MTTLESVLFAALAVLVLWTVKSMMSLKEEVQNLSYGRQSLERRLDGVREELEQGLATTRGHLARVSAGDRPPESVLLEGLPFLDVSAQEAEQMLQEESSEYYLLDVRTHGEYERGHIPGATLIPVDQLESRLGELPQEKGQAMVVHCQGGGRSAAACSLLASRGYSNLYNVADGFGGWRGAIETGVPST